jgi:capsular polysaccharide biosynthesis protein
VTDGDQTIIFSPNGDNGEPDRLGSYDDFAATENRPADFVPGLVSLGFINAAVRRSAWFLFVMSVVGLLIGFGAYVATPHEYQASATVVITHGPNENIQSAAVDNQAMAETRAVAGLAVHELGLKQSVSSFLSTYVATSITDELLTVTASAPSGNQAALRANAVASAFLKIRADGMQAEQNLVIESLDQQINQAKQRISSIGAQISQLSGQPTSPTQQSQISGLRAEQTNATATLTILQQTVAGNQATTQPAITAALKGSEILSVAPVPHSKLKSLIIYAAVGLIVGLALSLGIVVVRALVSDRLRRRDDIAYALNAPVKLSVGTLRARRWLPALPGRAANRDLNMRRVVAHLQSSVPRRTRGQAGLAIVAVDNAPVVARAVAALATSCASRGYQVVAADLSRGAHIAHLLGVESPGAHEISQNNVNFMMVLPDRDDAAPVGPLPAVTSPAGPTQAGDALAASYASADLLLTLVTLDPALGGDHLATWATNAVVVVSAGQSSAERVRGVGEMIRLAGTRLDSVVLIGADKSDESLGLTPGPDERAGIQTSRRG